MVGCHVTWDNTLVWNVVSDKSFFSPVCLNFAAYFPGHNKTPVYETTGQRGSEVTWGSEFTWVGWTVGSTSRKVTTVLVIAVVTVRRRCVQWWSHGHFVLPNRWLLRWHQCKLFFFAKTCMSGKFYTVVKSTKTRGIPVRPKWRNSYLLILRVTSVSKFIR